jgi:hypothetical protein
MIHHINFLWIISHFMQHNLTAQDPLSNLLDGDFSSTFLNQLTATFSLATLISPLLLLQPKKFDSGFPSSQIISVSGNPYGMTCSDWMSP